MPVSFAVSAALSGRFGSSPAGYLSHGRKEGEEEEVQMDTRADRGGGIGGISVGGIIVIIGIVLMFVWSFWIGLIVALVGLIAFGGFARGRWY